MDLKYFFANGTATFIKGPANFLNNEPKNPPDWITLDIWALKSFILIDILFSNAFLNFDFCLVVYNNSWSKLSPLNILILILKVSHVLFLTAVFNLFNRESDNLTSTLLLYCIQPFILFTELLLFFCKVLKLFLLIFQE